MTIGSITLFTTFHIEIFESQMPCQDLFSLHELKKKHENRDIV